MKAFSIDVDLAAAGLVLVLMNMAAIIPLWPGNVGLLQVAIATPLVGYGIPYAQGFAFGLGLQISRRQSASASGSCSLGGRGSRTRLCDGCRRRSKRSRRTKARRKPRKRRSRGEPERALTL